MYRFRVTCQVIIAVALLASSASPALAEDSSCWFCEDRWDPLANIEEHTTYMDGKLRISGSFRKRFESRDNLDFNSGAETNGLDETFLLTRLRLKTEWDVHESVTLIIPNGYIQLWNQTPPWGQLSTFNDIGSCVSWWRSNANPKV